MKKIRRLTVYMFLIGIITLLLAFFCNGDILCGVRNFLLQGNVFSVFKGKRDLFVNLLLGISTSAWFASLGFLVEYFNRKRELEKNLKEIYYSLRNKCYGNLFFENYQYEKDPNEVNSMCLFFEENRSVILDYTPFFLRLKVLLFRLLRFIRNFFSKKEKTDRYTYYKENKYALIRNLCAELNTYFQIIHMYQCNLFQYNIIIDACKNEITKSGDTDESEIYKTRLELIEPVRESDTAKLEELVMTKEQKKDLFKKFCAVDMLIDSVEWNGLIEGLIIDEIIK